MAHKYKNPDIPIPSFKVLLLPYQGPDFGKRDLPGLRIQPSEMFCYYNQSVLSPDLNLGCLLTLEEIRISILLKETIWLLRFALNWWRSPEPDIFFLLNIHPCPPITQFFDYCDIPFKHMRYCIRHASISTYIPAQCNTGRNLCNRTDTAYQGVTDEWGSDGLFIERG